jgi:hypothetical protein
MQITKTLLTTCATTLLFTLAGCSSPPKQVRPEYLLTNDKVGNLEEVAILFNAHRTQEAKAAQAKAAKEKPLFKMYSDAERDEPKDVDASLSKIQRMDAAGSESFNLNLDRHGRTWPYVVVTPGIYQFTVHCTYGNLYADISTMVIAQAGKTNFVSCTLKDEATKPVFKIKVGEAQDTDKNVLSTPITFY